ncbi:MAG: hypothetical protein AAB562_02640 [Patescibacteria group bacterium]
MDWSRKWRLVWRWSLLTSIPIALYWGIWYLVHRSIPSQALPTENLLASLFPYTISRWWDILIGPIWTTTLILLVTSKKMSDKQIPPTFGVSLLSGGFFIALLFVAPPPIEATSDSPELVALIAACVVLLLGLGAALFKGTTTLWGVLGMALASGLLFGLVHGILLGASGVVLILGFGGAGVVLGAGIRKIFQTLVSKATWQAVGRWLTAK